MLCYNVIASEKLHEAILLKKENLKMKKLLSIVLCISMLLTAIPLTAFAAGTEETQLPYCEIKFREGCSDELKVGETTEIYIDYCPGEYEEYELEIWTYSRYVCEMEIITDGSTGLVTGAIITALQEGTYYPAVSIKTPDGRVIEQDMVTIRVSEVDERPFLEKAGDWIKTLPSNIFMSLYLAFIAGGSMALSVFDIPKIIADWVSELYVNIKEKLNA